MAGVYPAVFNFCSLSGKPEVLKTKGDKIFPYICDVMLGKASSLYRRT